jgi:hypothetical protein
VGLRSATPGQLGGPQPEAEQFNLAASICSGVDSDRALGLTIECASSYVFIYAFGSSSIAFLTHPTVSLTLRLTV